MKNVKNKLFSTFLAIGIGLFIYAGEIQAADQFKEPAKAEITITPDKALAELLDGNKRYAGSKFFHPDQDIKRREEVAMEQHPSAIILTCSDSRVPPEVIFDQGLGDIFVIRVAGNTVDNLVLGSIEYGVEHLHAPLIVVLGHERCGAVTAAVSGEDMPGHLNSLTQDIKPAVESARKQSGDLLDNSIRININMVVEKLNKSEPILSGLIKEGKIKIVGAYYDLDTGIVNIVK